MGIRDSTRWEGLTSKGAQFALSVPTHDVTTLHTRPRHDAVELGPLVVQPDGRCHPGTDALCTTGGVGGKEATITRGIFVTEKYCEVLEQRFKRAMQWARVSTKRSAGDPVPYTPLTLPPHFRLVYPVVGVAFTT